jgi:hypothetical protein
MLKKAVSKAAANEEARRTLRYVELLSEARTPLADFFSILLEAGGVMGDGQSITIICAGGVSERGRRCSTNGVDGGPVRLHLVDGNAMGGRSSRIVTCLTGNHRAREVARAVLVGEGDG